MKKLLLKIFAFLCILPAFALCACKGDRSSLGSIDISRYFDAVKVTYSDNISRQIELSSLTKTKAEAGELNKYVKYEIQGNTTWIYKMYIDCIYFDIYTTDTSSGGNGMMTIRFIMTGLADESTLLEGKKYDPVDFEYVFNFTPEKNGVTTCKVEINKVVATATGANISIDINESVENTVLDSSKDFRWTIFNFQVYGESRTYNK